MAQGTLNRSYKLLSSSSGDFFLLAPGAAEFSYLDQEIDWIPFNETEVIDIDIDIDCVLFSVRGSYWEAEKEPFQNRNLFRLESILQYRISLKKS